MLSKSVRIDPLTAAPFRRARLRARVATGVGRGGRLRRYGLLVRTEGRLLLAAALALVAGPARAWEPSDLFAPCSGDCGVAIYAGTYVEDSMSEVLLTSPSPPSSWDYTASDHIVATAVSRRAAEFWSGRLTLEPEVGIGQRFGRQSATEVWGAVFLRYHGFPWDGTRDHHGGDLHRA